MAASLTTVIVLSLLAVSAGAGLLYALLRRASRLQPEGLAAWTGLTGAVLLILGGAGAVVLALTAETAGGGATTSGTVIGQAAPELRFRDVDTDQWRQLADYRGQVVVLNLWATWCPPCLDELPELNRLRRVYGSTGVEVITISDERPETIRRFEQELVEIETVNGYLPNEREWPAPYDRVLRSRPYSFIIGPEGRIRNMWAGARDFSFFARAVRSHLPDSSSSSAAFAPTIR